MRDKKVIVYTDGAAKGNPGKAGWGAVFVRGKDILEIGGGKERATNNQMELTAPIEALEYIKNNKLGSSVEIISDSKYVILGITEWIFNWRKNNWRNASRQPVLNRELWEKLYELGQKLKPQWTYIKGHNGDKYNDRADLIATSFAENKPVGLKNKH